MRYYIIIFFITVSFLSSFGQEKSSIELNMTLDQAIDLAKSQSIQSLINKSAFLEGYWQFKTYKASRLPSLILDADPITYYRGFSYNESEKNYELREELKSSGGASINQNVTLTGGTISLISDLERRRLYSADTTKNEEPLSFYTNPVNLSYKQPLSGYNEFRWQKKIEPLKYEAAKKEYLQKSEELSIRTVQLFFNLVANEINVKIAEINYNNADTLYNIAKGRFEIGTVTQDELLDLELGLLNAKIDRVRANLNLKQSQINLNSFLGLDESTLIKCIVPNQVPTLDLDVDNVLSIALENNPEIVRNMQRLLEVQQAIAATKASSGLAVSAGATYGVNDKDIELVEAYTAEFENSASYNLKISIPVLDWGERRGKIQIAKAKKDVAEAEVRQARIDFNQNVFQQVAEFNMQDEQVEVAAKADTIAALGYEVTKQRFLIDKVDVIKLNSARTSMDAARRNYVNSLRQYWNYYYSIRQLTLYDFERNISLMKDLDYLLEK